MFNSLRSRRKRGRGRGRGTINPGEKWGTGGQGQGNGCYKDPHFFISDWLIFDSMSDGNDVILRARAVRRFELGARQRNCLETRARNGSQSSSKGKRCFSGFANGIRSQKDEILSSSEKISKKYCTVSRVNFKTV